MAFELTMPQLAMSMTEGELTQWLVSDGETVNEGDPIYSVEADKATQEIEAPASGVLRQIAEVGSTYQVGDKLGYIE
ncbi:lipoyl domain-containing protein [Rhizorhabdus sp.]|jgi:pyruvate/2-oxoglutarate dehydrogenase complex dihydrolipoamide acyltransferase (E2) component|uniref:lipoyl domain-containing protein n=1 Tax=Rhizorhabdus sp. TaxID=1968843 RepID=UPI001990F390|nr:lipoyl domain-containing protein [Rhizorhabdus sp.]MBD3759621.1 dihydrolipoamide acyltransferase [Rhizorhabdus sp.]